MVRLSEGERAALEDIFAGLHAERLTILEKIVQFLKKLI